MSNEYYYEDLEQQEMDQDAAVDRGGREMISEAIAQAFRLTKHCTERQQCEIIVNAFHFWTEKDVWSTWTDAKEADAQLVVQLMRKD